VKERVQALFSFLVSFFLKIGTFPGFSKNTAEKLQLVACRFFEEFRVNSRNVKTNRKREISLCYFQKLSVYFKVFGVKKLKIGN
jgi:hypothetical protein